MDPHAPLPAHLDPRGRHRGSRAGNRPGIARSAARRKIALRAVQVLAATLSLALLVGSGYVWWIFRDLNTGGKRFAIAAGDNGRHDIDGKDQNILVVGNDDRQTASDAELRALGTGRDGGSLATDTMMIVHVPADGSKATLISLPRDSWVDIPGYGQGKLNSAYASAYSAASGSLDAKRAAGANLLIETITKLTGLTVDHYVQVDLLGFYRISNAVGGVPVNMCADVHDPTSGFHIKKGRHVIKGKQALLFVRQRYNFPDGRGDLDRVQRQQYFLTSAFRQVASVGVLFKLQSLSDAIRKSVYMDSELKLTELGRQLQNLTADNIVGRTIPTKFGQLDDGTSILEVDPTEVKTFVSKLIGPPDKTLAKAKAVSPSAVTVDVLNAGDEDLAAQRNADVLKQSGFAIGQVGTRDNRSSSTVIQYSDGLQAEAKTLAGYVPGATYEKVKGLARVRLVLGTDGLSAKPKPAPTRTASPAASSSSAKPPAKPSSTSTAPKRQAIDAGCIY